MHRINFLSLPDIGATYRQGNAEWRVWPGQALEVSRSPCAAAVSPGNKRPPFAGAAQSAIERWIYRPLECENRPCEVVSRLEVRFDSDFARSWHFALIRRTAASRRT